MATRHFLSSGLALFISLSVWGCTELTEEASPHPEGWALEHIQMVQTSNYDLSTCRVCHGRDFRGANDVAGCSNSECHTAAEGPEACDNCHGGITSAVFEDLPGHTDSRLITVGAHTVHYTAPRNLTSNVDCSACHTVPDSVWAAGHIDSQYAEIRFSDLATHDGVLTPVWDRTTGSCSSVYCHGSFNFNGVSGNDSSWTWTQPVSGNLCGTCHNLPPDGHNPEFTACGVCHSSVVNSDNTTIKNPAKHINGEPDF